MPLDAVCELRKFILPRPIYDRLELLATLCAGSQSSVNFNAFAHATRGDICEAIDRIAQHLNRPLSPKRWRHVAEAMQFLIDFPDQHRGNIIGLTNKSIRWHTNGRRIEVEKAIKRFGKERKVATPPIALPDETGVRFLATVGDVCAEGDAMEHCVARYVERAVDGRCFLFHVDHDGEQATIEVSQTGKVVQSQGPRNSANGATRWAKRVLSSWGKQFCCGDQHAAKPDMFYLLYGRSRPHAAVE